MPQKNTTLTLPDDLELLLNTIGATDRKVEALHPLLSLLEDEAAPYSEIGQTLLNALRHIQEELQELRILRQNLAQQIEAFTAVVNETKATQEIMAKQIEEMHKLLLSPLEKR